MFQRLVLSLLILAPSAWAEQYFEFSGKAGFESRFFFDDPLSTEQYNHYNASIYIQPEMYWEWNDGNDNIKFIPYARLDQHEGDRSHFDIRELEWIHVGENWESRIGVRKVYWGVTEFQHLVDVVNQIDGVEDIDGEDKLGQPMINLSLVRDWGIIDFLVMPYFRERNFTGIDSRLRPSLLINDDRPLYESSDKEKHLDYAIRWAHSIGDFDIGVHAFDGTDRDPQFIYDPIEGKLLPYYQQLTQVGVDIQATLGDWLWKLEAVHKNTTIQDYTAVQFGFEYTRVGVMESVSDLGMLLEYGWDERGKNSRAFGQNDIFIGVRLAFNDVNSTAILAGGGYDLDFHSSLIQFEASRRINDNWTTSLDVRLFLNSDQRDVLYDFREDNHLQLTFERYF